MRVAVVRMIRNWLESGNGGADALAALLPNVPRESGDAAPSAPAFDDETQDGYLSRRKASPDGATYPVIVIEVEGPLTRGPATAMPQEEVTGRVCIAYLSRDVDSAAALRAGEYVLRAAQRSLHRLNRETGAATAARTRGETTLVAVTASELRGVETADNGDVWATGSLLVDVVLRDTKPEG